MKALVTGASGFIGRRLVRKLARDGHDVVCLVRRTSLTAGLEGPSIGLAVGDVTDAASLDAALRDRDHIFHLAAVVQAADEKDYEAVNVAGTRLLVEAALRVAPAVKRFVLVSSIAAAGPSGPERLGVEDDEPRPITAYGRSKLAAERAVLQASGRLAVTIVRPPNVIGAGSPELERAMGLLRLKLVPAIGDGRPRTSLIDVDDLVDALVLAAGDDRAAGRTYYVTDGRAYAWPEITGALAEEFAAGRPRIRVPFAVQLLAAGAAEAAARLTGRRPALTRDIVRAGRDGFWLYDGSRIRQELGYRPATPMRESIRRAVETYRSRRVRPAGGQGRKAGGR
jgi:nucleoside-diphosphate-sugar epimerase